MIDVEILISNGKTRVWISAAVGSALDDLAKKDKKSRAKLLAALDRYAKVGFINYEGGGKPIRHEWDGVYRIGLPDSLFRILGFYDPEDKRTDYIAIDAMMKRDTKLGAGERGRIDNVAEVKRKAAWRRKSENEHNQTTPEGTG